MFDDVYHCIRQCPLLDKTIRVYRVTGVRAIRRQEFSGTCKIHIQGGVFYVRWASQKLGRLLLPDFRSTLLTIFGKQSVVFVYSHI
jgi:hypothetical protein